MSFLAATMGGGKRRKRKKRKLNAYQICMRKELKSLHLKGENKTERKKLFKKAVGRCS